MGKLGLLESTGHKAGVPRKRNLDMVTGPVVHQHSHSQFGLPSYWGSGSGLLCPPQIPSVWCDYVKLFNSVPWPPTPLITVISTQWPGLYLSVTMNMPSWVWGLAGLSSFPLPSPAPELVNWRPAWEAAGGCQGHEVRKPARTEALGWAQAQFRSLLRDCPSRDE